MSEIVDIVIEYKKEHRASIGALLASIQANKSQESVYHVYLWGKHEDKFAIGKEDCAQIRWLDKENSQNIQLGKVIFLKWNTLVLGDLADLYRINLESFDYGAVLNLPQNICYLPESMEKYSDAVFLIEFSKLQEVLDNSTEKNIFKVKEISVFFNLGLEELLDKQDKYDKELLMEKAGFADVYIPYLLQRAVIVRFEQDRSAEEYFDGILSELWLKYYKISTFEQRILRRRSYVETIGDIQLDSKKDSIPVMLAVQDDNTAYALTLIYSLEEKMEDEQQLDIRIVYRTLSELHKNMLLSAASGRVSVILYGVQRLAEFSPCYYAEMLSAAIFDEYDKVLYLDVKQICVDAIGKLYCQEIGNRYALATQKQVWGNLPVEEEEIRQRFLDDMPYVDTSVLLLNTNKWLQEELSGKIWMMDSIWKDKKVSYEKIFNYICQGNIGLIPEEWHELWSTQLKKEGFQPVNGFYQNVRYKQHFSILHYDGGGNPWTEAESEETQLLYKYAALSEYYELIVKEARDYGKEKSGIMDMRKIERLEKEKSDLQKKIAQLENELNQACGNRDQYLYELLETRKSFTYKVGRFITWLPRKIRHQ